jgi:hypothetical protein
VTPQPDSPTEPGESLSLVAEPGGGLGHRDSRGFGLDTTIQNLKWNGHCELERRDVIVSESDSGCRGSGPGHCSSFHPSQPDDIMIKNFKFINLLGRTGQKYVQLSCYNCV